MIDQNFYPQGAAGSGQAQEDNQMIRVLGSLGSSQDNVGPLGSLVQPESNTD